MILCKQTNRVFDTFVYRPVIWSGDSLPYCPLCRISPYDEDYKLTHETVIINPYRNRE